MRQRRYTTIDPPRGALGAVTALDRVATTGRSADRSYTHPPLRRGSRRLRRTVLSGVVHQTVRRLVESVGSVIVGKEAEVELCVLTLLCRGHVLIEDVPGVGKTMMAKALARSLGCQFDRVQFTPDL